MERKSRLCFLILLIMLLAACGKQGEQDAPPQSAQPSAPPALSGTAAPSGPEAPAVSAPEQELREDKSYIFVQRDTDATDGGVQLLLERMGAEGLHFYKTEAHPSGLIGAGDVVLLKINCQWAERGGTNTDLIRAVAEAVAAHPDGFTGEIVIADNGQAQYGTNGTGGSLSWERPNSLSRGQSAQHVIDSLRDRMRISGYLWDAITFDRVREYGEGDAQDGFVVEDEIRETGFEISYPKFTTRYGTRISFKNGIWDEAAQRYDGGRLKVINMPVLKSHFIYHVTGALKAYMGVVANQLTGHRPHKNVGNGAMGTMMANTRLPALNIMDMTWVGAGKGPAATYETAVPSRMLAASTDPVALDYWAAKYVLLPEVGAAVSANVDPDASAPGSFGHWLRLSAAELERTNLPARYREDDMVLIDNGGTPQ